MTLISDCEDYPRIYEKGGRSPGLAGAADRYLVAGAMQTPLIVPKDIETSRKLFRDGGWARQVCRDWRSNMMRNEQHLVDRGYKRIPLEPWYDSN